MKASLTLYLALLLTHCAALNDAASSSRLQISSLTIKVTYVNEKDGLTFTGNFPSTVLNEQELDLDTELTITFDVTDGESAVQPQQTMVMFQSKAKEDLATYTVAHPKGSKRIAQTTLRSVVQQLGVCNHIELSLLVGDSYFADGVVWNLGTIKMDVKDFKSAGLTQNLPPRRLHEPELKPEIHHLFGKPDARAPAVVSIFFSVLCFCPLIGFLNYVQKLGVNLKGLPSGSSRIWVVLFHVGLAMILILYTFFFFRLNLIQMIVPMTCLSAFCFFTGHQALCAVAGTMKKDKKD